MPANLSLINTCRILGGVSSLFFAFADLVIHSLFNTDPKDRTINNTSSYLDLSPLYGNSEKDVDSVRRKHPDILPDVEPF